MDLAINISNCTLIWITVAFSITSIIRVVYGRRR